MNQSEVPEGIPPLLRLAQVAAVLGFSETYIRGRARRGKLAALQLEKGCWRYIPAEEVARFAARLGLEPHWERVFDDR